nr:FKBP-type peptidyl-prolyl cis-trans isomerase [Rubritalea profundi]
MLSNQVTVHYHGTLIDGTVFDSSTERGSPASFAVNKVIEGWKEGIQLMSAGAKFQFFLPQNLAYGDRGTETTVPPFAALIFEVELLAIA